MMSKGPLKLYREKLDVNSAAVTYLPLHRHFLLPPPKHTPLCQCRREAICGASGVRTSREANPPRKLAMSSWVALSGMISLLSLAPIERQSFDLIVYCSLQKVL